MYSPFISIIIPTYNRANLLPLTLDSFIVQDYPRDRYEIIMADNNSTDTTREVAATYVGSSDVTVKYIFEQRQGVHYARNSASKQAKGDILYFTDDDMIADKDLLKEIIKPFFIDDKVASVTGTVLPKWEVSPPQWVLDLCLNGLLSLNVRKEDLLITGYDCGVYSCHQAIRRDVFFQSGGFNPENTAGEWIGDGETGLNLKITELGFKFAFITSAIIYHIIPHARMTQKYLNKRMANQGNCDSYTEYRKYNYSEFQLYKQICRHAANIFNRLVHYTLNVSRMRIAWRIHRAYLSYYIKRIKYDYRLIKDENWRRLVLKYNWLEE